VGGRGREGEKKGVELGEVPFECSNQFITLFYVTTCSILYLKTTVVDALFDLVMQY
jgi:hypothetical protein